MAIINNLNTTSRPPPPDLIQNLINYNQEVSTSNARIYKTAKNNRHDTHLRNNYQSDASTQLNNNNVDELKKKSKSGRHKFKRGLCCLGWIFCFPLFCLGWALRDAPLDKQDLREDHCYPCFE